LIERGDPEPFLFLMVVVLLVMIGVGIATKIDMYIIDRRERLLGKYPRDVREFME
jgi:hypothetical protein